VAVVRRIECTVTRVTDHGDRVYSVDLQPAIPAPRFLPGQFLHLALEAADHGGFWPESRVFSIASSPDERRHLSITYAAKGAFTTRMERELAPGKAVWAKLPYGEFFVDPTRDCVLFAGGTGVTAYTAFLTSLRPEQAHPVQLYYGARSPDLFVFGDLVRDVARRVPAVSARLVDEGVQGRLSVDAAWPAISTLDRPLFYLSGPPAMLAALTAQLGNRGVQPEDIRTDAWE
jgi:ferredoxin-NADP reductase